MITREEFENSYIVNDHSELRDKYFKLAEDFGYSVHSCGTYSGEVLFRGSINIMQEFSTLTAFKNSQVSEGRVEIFLKDFEEEEMETPVIDWSQAPEGYDYWIEYLSNAPAFHKLTSDGTQYIDIHGFHYSTKPDKDLIVHKRPEQVETKTKVKEYVRKEFKTRGEALDYFDTEGNTLYVPNIHDYTIANEIDMLDSFGQLFVLEERDQTWQDVAQEFIKNDPVLSEDKFVEDMFGNEFKGYHEPLKQLAKLIVENTK